MLSKHSKTRALPLGSVAVHAALEPCLEEWVLWGLELKGETFFHPSAVAERLGGTSQFGGAQGV